MFYGRTYELSAIKKAIESGKSEFGIIYGRRRIGKSELLKKLIKRKGDLYFEGLQSARTPKQIAHFLDQLSKQTYSPRILAKDWSEAFDALTHYIHKGKHYIVFDEFPLHVCLGREKKHEK